MFCRIIIMAQVQVSLYLDWPPDKECVSKNSFCYCSTKTYVVGIQKNCLNEMFLSTQNAGYIRSVKNKSQVNTQKVAYLDLCLEHIQL